MFRPLFIALGVLLLAGRLPAFEIQGVIKRLDVDQRQLTITAGQQDHAIRVPEGVKVFDAAGKELPDGLKAADLCEGARVRLEVERDGDRPALRAIHLGGKGAPSAPAASGPVEQQDTSALVPLIDLGKDKYQGFEGGLYPEGKNTRPADHEAAGVTLARQVQPFDAQGQPSPDGRIVLLGIGFSNTVQAFGGFMEVAQADSQLNPKLLLVNGAVGGMSAFNIQNPDDQKTGTRYWTTVGERLKSAGVTPAQVQVVWIKETDPGTQQVGGFPKCIQTLQAELTKIVQIVTKRFPNVKLAYLSSRTYGGWAKRKPGGGAPGNCEPFSYESGFAVKWLIQQQLQGVPELNFDPAHGPQKAPWLSWAAYLWTNGPKPRSDGLFFELDDYRDNDRMHESLTGQKKVGKLLLDFFKSDPTSKSWFVRK